MVKNQKIDRRKFLTQAVKIAGATAAFSIVPRHVLGGPAHIPPSETLTHAIIGVGGIGKRHIQYVLNDNQGRLSAVCDVDTMHLDQALKMAGEGCDGYRDFRKVLERSDIDIVHICTPPSLACCHVH